MAGTALGTADLITALSSSGKSSRGIYWRLIDVQQWHFLMFCLYIIYCKIKSDQLFVFEHKGEVSIFIHLAASLIKLNWRSNTDA